MTKIKYMILFLLPFAVYLSAQTPDYPWLNMPLDTVVERVADISVPAGFKRVQTQKNSFANWLRHLPLKKAGAKVHLFDGSLKANQQAHYRIINMDVGRQDLQQCADAVMRLRAEYLYAHGKWNQIRFKLTNGDMMDFKHWKAGYRPQIKNGRVHWRKMAAAASGYKIFKKYLRFVFMYAGSYSLSRELSPVVPIENIQIGDVFIYGGFPGHAVIVVDMAGKIGVKAFLLAQSYMPAQEIHILRNLKNADLNPWYILKRTGRLFTPEWTFDWEDLKRFK